MGSGGGSSSKTTTEIPKWARPYYEDLFAGAQQAQYQVPSEPYPGPFIAPPDPLQLESLGLQEQFARGLDPALGQNVTDLANRTIGGDFLSAESNPYLQSAITAATRPALEAGQAASQQAGSQAIQQGAFGGNREAILQGNIATGTAREAGDIASQLSFMNLANERQLQQQAPALLQQGLGLQQLPGQVLGGVGDLQRQFQQQEVEEGIRAFEEQVQAPFRGYNQMAAILHGFQPGAVTTQTGAGLGGPSTGQSILSGALGAASTAALVEGLLNAP